MTDSITISAFRELVDRGLIAAQPAAQPLPAGNIDRRDLSSRSSWRVNLPDARPARLILGTGLADLAQRQTAFARACPALIPAPVFHQPLSSGDAFACLFFEGVSLEAAAADSPKHAQAGLARVCAELAATAKSSTESARLAEWQTLTDTIESLEIWTPVEKQLLHELVWERLYQLLSLASPATRWSNGDFTSSNILLDHAGGQCLIDCEFACETHFFAEDAVRFHALSPAAQRCPELFSAILPLPGPAWHLFFWLRQLALESAHNTAAYLARVRVTRLGVIRRLGEEILGGKLTGWSVEPATVHHNLEVARWEQTSTTALRVTGWCHARATVIRSIVVTQGDGLLVNVATEARPDVQAHFAGEACARDSGFNLAIPLREPDVPLVISALVDDGTLLPFHSFRTGDLPGRGPWIDDYTRWATIYDPDPIAPSEKAAGPLFSILLPIYNTPPGFLHACLQSVRTQHYSRWELCVVDDFSSAATVQAQLADFASQEPRINIKYRAGNGGIACATNDALQAAKGEFIVLLDHDDALRPHTLTQIAERLSLEPALDALYSDEDKITAEGVRLKPFLKPDFSPEFLLGVMYVGHALCVRTSLARAVGGFDPAFDGVQDYEFFLRVTEKTKRIGHIPRILYHWRQSPGSSAQDGNVKGDMDRKQADAVRAHLQRQGRTEEVELCGGHRLRLHPTTVSTVEIVRPAAGEDVRVALQSAAKTSPTKVLVILAVEPQNSSENWVQELAALAERPDTGLVAPLLLSCEGRVLESGRTFGPDGAVPLMRGFDANGDGYNGSLLSIREVVAVSQMCFAIRRDLAVATLTTPPTDESWLEFCYRLRTQGQFHRICPTARLQLTNSWRDPVESIGTARISDPFFNPHFDPHRADYSLAKPPVHISPVIWHLDSPHPSTLPNGCLSLRGWCFGTDGRVVRAIRVNTGKHEFLGVTGLPRPDVRSTLPGAPDENTGFEVRGILPADRIALSLEIQLSDESWHQLMCCMVDVKQRFLPLWLGGGSLFELEFQQTPAYMTHPPRMLKLEKYPVLTKVSNRPKLSIVTPSYRQAQFLEETIRSVLEQAGVDCQYVVQDGGSADGSAGIIRRYAGSLHGWVSAADNGQADAIMKGFAKTTGGPADLMAWINSDDFHLPGALAYVVDYFARHPEVDVLYGHRIVVNEKSQEIARWFLPKHDEEVLRLNDFVPQETLFWRRQVWDKVGGLDTTFKFAMDWDLLLRFQAAGARIVRVPYFLACFRIHPAQKTSAAMHGIGQKEIALLRERTHGRPFPPQELENNPRLIRYLRRSAFIEFMWKRGIRLA